jgi:hypothetical protein
MDMIMNKGIEYDEVVDNYEYTLQRKNDTLDQYEKSMARLIIVNQELLDTCIVLEKNTAAFDSLRAMIDKMKEEQHIYWAMPFSVDFDFENIHMTNIDMGGLYGFQTLPNGMEILGLFIGGDWEIPVNVILYLKNGKLYNYIPVNGNIFDRVDYKAFDENVFENNDKLMYNKSLMIKEICEYFT